jgi:hypothetical protein
VLVSTVYLVLVLAGITTSSIGVESLRDDPTESAQGLLAGSPRPIRSDDFLRSSPWSIGGLIDPDQDRYSRLAYPDVALVGNGAGGVLTRTLYTESTAFGLLGRGAPEQAFAAGWWFASLLVALLLPAWLRRMGAADRIAIPVTILVLLAPANAWWSGGPVAVLVWTLVPAVAAMRAADLRPRLSTRRRALVTVGWTLVAGWGMARLVLSYQPWAVPLALAMLVPTLVFLLAGPARIRRVLTIVASTLAVAAVAAYAYLAEHTEALEVLTDTVYPGARRSTGDLSTFASLFGAPHLWVMQRGDVALASSNQSEISSGYLLLGVAALVVVGAVEWSRRRPLDAATIASLVTIGLLSTWITAEWPSGGSRLFPMSLVVPARLAQVIGIVATIAFGLVLAAAARDGNRPRRATALSSAVAVGFVTLIGGSSLRESVLLTYRTPWIAVVTVLTSVAIYVAVRHAGRRWSLAPLVLLAVPVVAVVNPVQHGFGDLVDGAAARQVRELARGTSEGAWASDDYFFDAVLMATAQQTLSGQQWVGPRESAWAVLDPDELAIETWNRGASFVTFQWAPQGAELVIDLPGADVVRVNADPCDPRLVEVGLKVVSSVSPLEHGCLRSLDTIQFGGRPHYVYERVPDGSVAT